MQIAVNGIIGGQVIGKTGNATITIMDLDCNGQVAKFTLQGMVLSEQSVGDKRPRQFLLDGVEFRSSDRGLYVTAKNLVATVIGEAKPAKS